MTNHQFAAAVVNMIDDPSAYGRCSMVDLVLIDGVLSAIRSEIEQELAQRKRQPRLKVVR